MKTLLFLFILGAQIMAAGTNTEVLEKSEACKTARTPEYYGKYEKLLDSKTKSNIANYKKMWASFCKGSAKGSDFLDLFYARDAATAGIEMSFSNDRHVMESLLQKLPDSKSFQEYQKWALAYFPTFVPLLACGLVPDDYATEPTISACWSKGDFFDYAKYGTVEDKKYFDGFVKRTKTEQSAAPRVLTESLPGSSFEIAAAVPIEVENHFIFRTTAQTLAVQRNPSHLDRIICASGEKFSVVWREPNYILAGQQMAPSKKRGICMAASEKFLRNRTLLFFVEEAVASCPDSDLKLLGSRARSKFQDCRVIGRLGQLRVYLLASYYFRLGTVCLVSESKDVLCGEQRDLGNHFLLGNKSRVGVALGLALGFKRGAEIELFDGEYGDFRLISLSKAGQKIEASLLDVREPESAD